MQNKKGFTLIELLVVVLIIAILSAVALPQYIKTVERTRSTEALLNLKAFTDAANRYWMAADQTYVGIIQTNGEVTATNIANVDITLPTTGWFKYYVGGATPAASPAIIAAPTAETLILGAARDVPAARKYSYNYFLLNGELVARTCASNDATLCKGLVTITSTSPATCPAGAVGAFASGTPPTFNTSNACVIRN